MGATTVPKGIGLPESRPLDQRPPRWPKGEIPSPQTWSYTTTYVRCIALFDLVCCSSLNEAVEFDVVHILKRLIDENCLTIFSFIQQDSALRSFFAFFPEPSDALGPAQRRQYQSYP
ncbi:hypothetical protein N7G274_003327 [Stereocaulon virgatum]|uniref:Uncharacterized protein n=1 Tax=Stereocaulon virgatum TaxID=373712 RepID=A0ABR4ADA8_9LECA